MAIWKLDGTASGWGEISRFCFGGVTGPDGPLVSPSKFPQIVTTRHCRRVEKVPIYLIQWKGYVLTRPEGIRAFPMQMDVDGKYTATAVLLSL